jgi:hypothetical protein
MVGAREMAAIAEQLQRLGDQSDLTGAPDLIAQLEQAFHRVQLALEAERPRSDA